MGLTEADSPACGWGGGLGRGGSRTRGGEPGRSLKPERSVRPPAVAVVPPGGRDRPGIAEAFEDLQCQALVTDRLWMLLGIAVLPRAAGLDGER